MTTIDSAYLAALQHIAALALRRMHEYRALVEVCKRLEKLDRLGRKGTLDAVNRRLHRAWSAQLEERQRQLDLTESALAVEVSRIEQSVWFGPLAAIAWEPEELPDTGAGQEWVQT